ncbi:MAG: carbonic anhydrase [Methanolinea sp.]|nr:carbonic anhydrase [Methanolinea sp.]
MIDQLLEGNRRFREGFFKDNLPHYRQLSAGQNPSVLWITCSDSRIQSGHITQTMPGTLFVHRNIGNIVPLHDWNFATVLEYAIRHLKVKDIVICGHSDCGAMKALGKETDDKYIPLWLANATEAKRRVEARIPPPTSPEEERAKLAMIERENVILQIEHLKNYPIVKEALLDKKISIHGLYYNMETGELTKIA